MYSIEGTLNSAVSNIHLRMVLVLICYSMEGITPEDDLLFKGACTGSLIHLESALAQGAKMQAEDGFNMTALHWAAFNGHPDCLEVLLRAGAQIEVRDCVGLTSLHRAARGGHQKCIKLLLEKGAQIETRTKKNWTPLHEAAFHGRIECLKIVLLGSVGLLLNGMSCTVIASPQEKVEISIRRLKVALLSLRYEDSRGDGPKSKNLAGDLIVSNEYLRAWFLLAHSGLREDVFTVLLNLLANGGKVNYALFRLAHTELGDYLVVKLRDTLARINASEPIVSVRRGLDVKISAEIAQLSDPDLVEENFGDLIRNGIKARFNELLKTSGIQENAPASQSSSSYQSTSSLKEQTDTRN